MYDPKKLRERIMRVLEQDDSKCLGSADDRREIADALFETLDWFLNDARYDEVVR